MTVKEFVKWLLEAEKLYNNQYPFMIGEQTILKTKPDNATEFEIYIANLTELHVTDSDITYIKEETIKE